MQAKFKVAGIDSPDTPGQTPFPRPPVWGPQPPVNAIPGQDVVYLEPVPDPAPDPNQTFKVAAITPNGDLALSVTDQAAAGQFEFDKVYAVTITPVP